MPALYSIYTSHKQQLTNTVGTWADLKETVANPRTFSKELSDNRDSDGELISNKYFLRCLAAHNCNAKTKEAIKNHNSMSWLRVDSDENFYTIPELTKALVNLGINTFVIHTSWSHKESFNKLKCLIPLAAAVTLDDWSNLQERLTEALHTDECMNNMTQISYEPATYPGHCYEHYTHEAGAHDFSLLPQLKPKPVMQKREKMQYDGESLIEEYNSRFDWDFELSASGYKKKGKKWLSPTATSKIAGGSVFTGDDGKQLFHTHHASDPIHALGAVDGFGFTCLMENKTPSELVLSLSTGELKEWNKQKQKEFAESKEQAPVISDSDLEKFTKIFEKKKETLHPLFGNIKAANGAYAMPKETETAVQKVMKTVQFAPKNHQPEKIDYTTPSYVFPTPVDESIDLYSAPGLVGECVNYINSVGRKPRLTLAVSTALSCLGMVGGLTHVCAEYGATSNLFCFNIAGSGSGKEAVLQAGNEIIQQSGITNSLFGKIKSEQEIYRNLINSQAAYYNIDEIGEVLGKITASTESYMTGIIGTLMSLYSKASGKINLGGDELADIKERTSKRTAMLTKRIEENEDKTGTAQQEIDKLADFIENLNAGVLVDPFLAISGCTTPELFSKIATKQNVLSGFIGRSLMFMEHNDTPRSNPNFNHSCSFPVNLSHELKKVFNIGSQKTISVGRTQNYGRKIQVTTTGEAKEWLRALQYNIETQAIEHSKTDGLHPIINRQFELILKVSLVLAIGDGKVRTLEHVKWAQFLVSRDVETKIDMVNGNNEDDEKEPIEVLEDMTSKIEKFLANKEGAFLPSRIRASIRGLDAKTATKILLMLAKQGRIVAVEEAGKKTKFKSI